MGRSPHQILAESRVIAVVGASPRHHRESNKIFRYLLKQGFNVLPVNPLAKEIQGIASYPDLASIPSDIEIDIVNVFRRPEHVFQIVQMALERSILLKHKIPVIWTQLGVSSDDAKTLAEGNDIEYIRNRCILVEHSLMPTS